MRGTQARVLRFDRPKTALEAKFSIQFAVTCALLRGRVGLRDLDDRFVASDLVQSMFAKIHFTHLPLNSPQQTHAHQVWSWVDGVTDGRGGEGRWERGGWGSVVCVRR